MMSSGRWVVGGRPDETVERSTALSLPVSSLRPQSFPGHLMTANHSATPTAEKPDPDEPVRWLDAGEQRVWRSFLEASRLLFDALDRELQADAGMPHAYYEILVRLSETADRTMRMSELADSLSSSRSRLSHAVARLEERGWVRRQADPADRRGQWAILTDAGFAALVAAAPGHVGAVRRQLFDPLTPEDVAALGRISDAVRRAGTCDGPVTGSQL
jgi:DNA-binding MarR family transcriptional regulator